MSFLVLVNFGKGHGCRGIVAMSHIPKSKPFDQNLMLFWHPVNHGQFHLNFRFKVIFVLPDIKFCQKHPTKKKHVFSPSNFMLFQTKTSSSCNQPTNGLQPRVFTKLTRFCGSPGFVTVFRGMDYRFVELRCNELCSFPYVQLSHSGLDQPPTYELHAKRRLVGDGWWCSDGWSWIEEVISWRKGFCWFWLVVSGFLQGCFDFVFFGLQMLLFCLVRSFRFVFSDLFFQQDGFDNSFVVSMFVFVRPIKHL